MCRLTTVFALLCFLIGSNASAREEREVCPLIFKAANSLIKNVEAGRTEDDMRGSIPPMEMAVEFPEGPQKKVLLALHEMLDEVFGGQYPNAFVYSTYREEICFREYYNLSIPDDFEQVRARLIACGGGTEYEQIDCAKKLAE